MDELIRLCATAARVACLRMTPLYLKVLPDSVEQARRMPSKVRLGPQVAAHAGIFNLLADVAGDPVLAVRLRDARGHISDLMVTVGPAADGIILSSRRRLLALIRAGEADDVAREMEQHLGGPVLDAAPVPQLSTDRRRCLTWLILRTWKLLNSRQGHSTAVLT
jgi:DNA-binding FadR family transcriptional regulator